MDNASGLRVAIDTASDQYRCRISYRSRYDIYHPVHAIGEVNVESACLTEHDLCAGRDAAVCVRCTVAEAVICLDFSDHNGQLLSAIFSDEIYPDERA